MTNNLKPLTAAQVEGARQALNTMPTIREALRALPTDGSRSAALVKLLTSIGFTGIEAVQIVLGHDAVEKMAAKLYNDLRSKATA